MDSAASALLAILPQPFPAADCSPDPESARRLGATAQLTCSGASTIDPDGPEQGAFSSFTEQSAMKQAYDDAVRAGNLQFIDNETVDLPICRDRGSLATGYNNYNRDGGPGGDVGCYIDAGDGAAYLFWTDVDALAFGYVMRSDGDAAKLYDWWQANDFKVAGR